MSTTTELTALKERIAALADAHEAIGWHSIATSIRDLLEDS